MNDSDSPPLPALVLPLASAMMYVIGALLLRRAADYGVGFWRTTFVANLICVVVFAPLWLLGGTFHLELLWQPAVVALLFILGSVLNFISLDRGDVSIATPVLGIKIILVALFSTLFGGQFVPLKVWLAAALSTTAIALLNRTRATRHHHVTSTILAAGSSAASFALFDVLVQKWSPAWGLGRFPPIMLGFVAIYVLGLVPRFPGPLKAIPGPAWLWLLSGSLVMAVQSLIFVGTVAAFGHATTANVIYSSRGLWSVVVVWIIGHWFHNTEQQLGSGIFRWRLVGSALMLAAIALVLW
ncbi:MAG TPA: DMT family transporter [Pirellulaceae bacterium]|nr:DMT family transporter [Pirellulaceae bacterium]